MRLRHKILLGFTILILMLSIAGAFYITDYKKINHEKIQKNQEIINLTNDLIEILEDQNEGILAYGFDSIEVFPMLQDTDHSFLLTIHEIQLLTRKSSKDKNVLIVEIQEAFSLYKKQRQTYLSYSKTNLNNYYYEYFFYFDKLRKKLETLQKQRRQQVQESTIQLTSLSKRELRPGLVIIIAVIIFALLFAYFIIYFFVRPIEKAVKKIDEINKYGGHFNVKSDSDDEIKKLLNQISKFIISKGK